MYYGYANARRPSILLDALPAHWFVLSVMTTLMHDNGIASILLISSSGITPVCALTMSHRFVL